MPGESIKSRVAKNSQQHLRNEANVTAQKYQPCSQVTFSLSHDVIFLMVSPLLKRFFVSFNLQSVVCTLRSAVCSLQSCSLRSEVCKCHTPLCLLLEQIGKANFQLGKRGTEVDCCFICKALKVCGYIQNL